MAPTTLEFMDAHADLNLRWVHTQSCGKCRVLADITDISFFLGEAMATEEMEKKIKENEELQQKLESALSNHEAQRESYQVRLVISPITPDFLKWNLPSMKFNVSVISIRNVA